MNTRFVLSLIGVLLLAGCTSSLTKDITLDTVADPKAKFSGYGSYTWLGAAAIVNDPQGQWKPPSFDADMEIKFLIDRELRKRGMSENAVNPDLIVAFATGVNMDALQLKVNPETKMETLENVPKGGLIISLIDSETGFVIWLGVAKANVKKQPDVETVKIRLDYAVTQLLKKLPD